MKKSLRKRFGITATLLVLVMIPADALGLRMLRGENDESFTILEGEFSVTKGSLEHLFARETGHAILKEGARIDRLVATDQSEVDVNDAAETTYIEADRSATIRISDGVVGYLVMRGNSRAHIKKIAIKKAIYPVSGRILTEGGIIFGSGAVIEIRSDSVSFGQGRLKGRWADGEPFSIPLLEHRMEHGEDAYEIPASLPQQIHLCTD